MELVDCIDPTIPVPFQVAHYWKEEKR